MVFQLKKTLIILLKLYCIEIFFSNVDFYEGILFFLNFILFLNFT